MPPRRSARIAQEPEADARPKSSKRRRKGEDETPPSRKKRVKVEDEAPSTKKDRVRQNDEINEDVKPQRKDQANASGRGYWLMKAEQEDREVQVKNGNTINTKFTIDDLEAKGEPEPWDGVRNLVARNNMRAMKEGELAFFYASGGKGKNKPSITGIMTIVKEHEADFTMSDEGAYGYVEPNDRGTDDKPKWSLVHVGFKEKLVNPVGLAELRMYSAPGKPLADMQLLRNGRISVSRVSEEEWDFIMKELVR